MSLPGDTLFVATIVFSAFYMLGSFKIFYSSISVEPQVWMPIPMRSDPILASENILQRYNFVSSYGLFRRMTGVGGRPELMIEGSSDG